MSLPLTPDEERRALAAIGVQSVEDLFATIPPRLRENAAFSLDLGYGLDGSRSLSEGELVSHFGRLALKNACEAQYPPFRHFLGGGTYDPVAPAAVAAIARRGEYLTAPIPLVPETSQATLQAVFELQSLVRRIAACDVAAVTYSDGAVAAAEATLAAARIASARESRAISIARSVIPDTQAVVRSFLSGRAARIPDVPYGPDGTLDLAKLAELVASDPPGVLVVQTPNRFGNVEPIAAIRATLGPHCLLVAIVPDVVALSVFEPPSLQGADITCGELQSLGAPLSFGGARQGFVGLERAELGQLSGWLSAETPRGYRPYFPLAGTDTADAPKWTCPSGGGSRALRAAATLALLGTRGFVEWGERCHALFRYLVAELHGVGIPLKFKGGALFREGVFEVPNLEKRFLNALQKGIVPGIRLGEPDKPQGDFSNCLLVCCHPRHTRADIDHLVEVLSHD